MLLRCAQLPWLSSVQSRVNRSLGRQPGRQSANDYCYYNIETGAVNGQLFLVCRALRSALYGRPCTRIMYTYLEPEPKTVQAERDGWFRVHGPGSFRGALIDALTFFFKG